MSTSPYKEKPARKPLVGNGIIPFSNPESPATPEPDFRVNPEPNSRAAQMTPAARHTALNAIGYGLGLTHKKRVEQVIKHGYTPETDQQYTRGELLTYARYWLSHEHDVQERMNAQYALQNGPTAGWPDECFAYDRTEEEERLAIAAALLMGEIDRKRWALNHPVTGAGNKA